MNDYIGQIIENYRIEALLGQGGMGAVFEATDLKLARKVALKVMHTHLSREKMFQQRFLQEARAAARLNHPSIVSIYHFGAREQLLYLVMQYIPGGTLRRYLLQAKKEARAIHLGESLGLLAQAADALGYAHEAGVIHRDVKPDNLLLEPPSRSASAEAVDFRVVLTDFGLAKLVEGGLQTSTGTFMGTLPYMSPEQCLGQPMDGRSDIYALGVLLYQLAAGSLPFDIQSPTDAVMKHQHEVPPHPHSLKPSLPDSVVEIILRAIAKSPADRYQRAEALADDLRTAAQALPAEAITRLAPPGTELISLATQLQASLVPAPGPSVLEQPAPRERVDGEPRIEVLSRETPLRIAPWKEGGLTIGRGAENDITLNDPKVSRQHARIDRDPAGFQVTDLESANGTFLGDQRLLPHVPERWLVGKVVRVGNHWLRLAASSEQAAASILRPDGSLVDASMLQTSPGEGRLALHLENNQISVEPGATASTHVEILNQGPVVDHFRVAVEGLPADWVELPERIQLLPGSQGSAPIRIRPPREPGSQAGRHPFRIVVTSEDSPGQTAQVEGTLTLGAFEGLEARLRPEAARAGQQLQITVTNLGNSADTYSIGFEDPGQELQFDPPETKLRIEAGDSAQTAVSARPAKRPLLGGERKTRFTAEVTSASGVGQTLSGQIASRGLIPVWVIPAFIFLCLLLSSGGWLAFQNIGQSQRAATGTALAAVTATAEALLQLDTDGDGLTNIAEVELGTDPTRPDTDQDGLSDKIEVEGCTLPLDPDTDRDGLLDGEEPRLNADPCVADTDGDNLPDGDEVRQGTNPANPDTDGDGTPDNVDPNPGQLPTNTPSPTLSPTPSPVPTETPTVTPTPTPDITSNLLVYFPFDGDLADASSSGYQAEWWTDANCRSFVTDRDGFAERAAGIDICPGNSPSPPYDFGLIESDHVHFNNQFSIAGWFWNDAPGGNPVWLVGQAGWYSLYLRRGDGEVRFGAPNSAGPDEAFVMDPNNFERNVWTYLTLVVSSDGTNSNVTLYRDGDEIDSAAIPAFTFSNPGSEKLHIGATLLNNSSRVYMYRGGVDDLSIYGRALSASEVAYLYTNGGRPLQTGN